MVALSKDPDVREALRSIRSHFIYAGLFDAVSNLLALAYPLYIFNVYSRVLESRSTATLVALFTGFALAVGFKALFDVVDAALFQRASLRLDRRLSDRLVAATFRQRAAGRSNSGAQVLRDLETYRSFVTGKGSKSLLGIPWAGFYLGVIALIDPVVGVVALAAAVASGAIEVAKVAWTKDAIDRTGRQAISGYLSLDTNLQAAEAVVGMGMLRAFLAKWNSDHIPTLAAQTRVRLRNANLDSLGAAARLLFQGTLVAVACFQVVQGEAPSAIIFVAVILFSFAMRPLQRIVGAWTDYISVRQGLQRIEDVLRAVPALRHKMPLPRPEGVLTVRGVSLVPPGSTRPILRNINFGVRPGESVGVIGLMGSGKTTLARLIVGCLHPSVGHVRLDGRDVWDWAQAGESTHVGYLPQTISLLPATVAENIGHFGSHDEHDVVEAARIAGIHDMILRLPSGYDTPVGDGGHPISGGQRQLIGLARAVVGSPALVVLDEPNSNLDGPGEESLVACLETLKAAKVTLVMISHKPSLVRQLDKALLLKEGQVVGFGTTSEIYERLGRPMVVKRSHAG